MFIECSFDGCNRPRQGKGLCNSHRRQQRNGQELKPLRFKKVYKACRVDNCERDEWCRGLCHTHYCQDSQGKELGDIKPNRPKGEGSINDKGYRTFYMPEHANAGSKGRVYEHTMVMSEILGRPLAKGESVHHKNGNRLDNRPDNLELWSVSQPYGQRIEDKVEWAVELLKEHAPELLK